MDLKLNGKLALVSGSTAGIGLAIAEALGARRRAGHRQRPHASRRRRGGRAACAPRPAARCMGFAGDLGAAAAAEDGRASIPDVEILVNNLGIFEPKPFEEIPDADWMRFFEVNVLSGVRLARLYLPAMRRAELGPHHLHLQRERRADPGRDDPLRHDQDGADRRLARPGRGGRRHRHHRQQRSARPDQVRAASTTSSTRLAKPRARRSRSSRRSSSRRCGRPR